MSKRFARSIGAESRLLALHRAESKGPTTIHTEFADLFEDLPDGGAVQRVRAALDSAPVLAPDGNLVGLYDLVLALPDEDMLRVLQRLHCAVDPLPGEDRGFVPIFLGAAEAFSANAGARKSESGDTDSGARTLLRELIGRLGHGRDYPAMLLDPAMDPRAAVETSDQPTGQVWISKRSRLGVIASGVVPRLPRMPLALQAQSVTAPPAVMPGMATSMAEYSWLFPDFGGRFVVLGREEHANGVKDVSSPAPSIMEVAEAVLSLDVPCLAGCNTSDWAADLSPLVAFVALRTGSRGPACERAADVADVRSRFPAISLANYVDRGSQRHRFFLFDTSADLAAQLATAGWISAKARQNVEIAAAPEAAADGAAVGGKPCPTPRPTAVLSLPPPPTDGDVLLLRLLRVVRGGKRVWSSMDPKRTALQYAALRQAELLESPDSASAKWAAGPDGVLPPVLRSSQVFHRDGHAILEVCGHGVDRGTAADDLASCLVSCAIGDATAGASCRHTVVLSANLVDPSQCAQLQRSGRREAEEESVTPQFVGEVTVSCRWASQAEAALTSKQADEAAAEEATTASASSKQASASASPRQAAEAAAGDIGAYAILAGDAPRAESGVSQSGVNAKAEVTKRTAAAKCVDENMLCDTVLFGPSVSGEALANLLSCLKTDAEVAHRDLTHAWGSPLSLLAADAEVVAAGAPAWTQESVLEAPGVAEEAAILCDLAGLYEMQVHAARSGGHRLARAPLMDLARRLRMVTQRLRGLLEPLLAAKAAGGMREGCARGDAYRERGSGGDACVDLPEHILLSANAQASSTRRWPFNIALLQELDDTFRRSLESCLDVVASLGKLVAVPRALAASRAEPPRASPGGVDWPLLMKSLGAPSLAEPVQRFSAQLSAIFFPSAPPLVRATRSVALEPRQMTNRTSSVPASLTSPTREAQLSPWLTTGYWNFRGLGAPLRMMCAFAELEKGEHEDIKYEVWQRPRGGGWIAPEWEASDKPKLLGKNAFAKLPYVVNHINGDTVCGSVPCYSYLGRALGLVGATPRARVAEEQALAFVHGMQMELYSVCYPFKGVRDESSFLASLGPHFGEILPNAYERLEELLDSHSGGDGAAATLFLVGGETPTASDFVLLEVIDQNEVLARSKGFGSPLAAFEALGVFYERMRALPGLKRYFDSYDASLPINNKMAFFK